jgi:hypothetical protein
MKESGFESTAVMGKWFEVNDLNHSATDAPNKEEAQKIEKKRIPKESPTRQN